MPVQQDQPDCLEHSGLGIVRTHTSLKGNATAREHVAHRHAPSASQFSLSLFCISLKTERLLVSPPRQRQYISAASARRPGIGEAGERRAAASTHRRSAAPPAARSSDFTYVFAQHLPGHTVPKSSTPVLGSIHPTHRITRQE
jgi:hypothetical protein